MKTPSKALLIVGSLRRPRSSSEALGTYLLKRLAERGWEVESLRLKPWRQGELWMPDLLPTVQRAHLLVLAFPLYVDSLPALVIRALEAVAAQRKAASDPARQQLLALVNCGFPEAPHNEPALAICRRFATEAGIEWVGGLALGAGGVVDGNPPASMGRMLRKALRALDLSVEALAGGRAIPPEAVELMAKPLMPARLYTLIGNLGWRWQARKNGVKVGLDHRPYEP